MAIIKTKKTEQPRWRKNRTENTEEQVAGKRFLARLLFNFLLFCFGGVSVYVLLFAPFMQLEKITIAGNREIATGEIEKVVDAYLTGKYLGILPKNNFLLTSKARIEKNVLESFKKVRRVAVRKQFPDKLNIEVEERKSLLVWCSGENCYLVDDQGLVYQAADFASREVQENHLLKITQSDGKQVEMGMQVMNADMVGYYGSLRETFAQKAGIKLGEEIRVNSRLAEDGVTQAEQGFEILVNFSIPAERSAELMKTFLDKQYKGGDLANLAYVDLRVENKIFYKTK